MAASVAIQDPDRVKFEGARSCGGLGDDEAGRVEMRADGGDDLILVQVRNYVERVTER